MPSPITRQQEVSCYYDKKNSGGNVCDIWIVEKYDEDDEQYEDEFWHVGIPVIIHHVQSGKLLHSHNEPVGDGQNEVTGFEENDDNSRWVVSFD